MTFSIAARCERSGSFGVAIASSSPAVASRCAFVSAGVGAAITQNVTDPRLGPALLDALWHGATAEEAVAKVAETAEHLDFRQFGCVDTKGRAKLFSGESSLGVVHEITGPNFVTAGNLLASTGVIDSIASAFHEHVDVELSERLMRCLEAAIAAGGEAGPVRSAGMLIATTEPWPTTNLRVDDHDEPIAELRRILDLWKPQAEAYVTRALDPTQAPSYGVPGDE